MEKQKISPFTLALLLFVTVFGISNIANNYSSLGNSAIGWFTLLAIYFIPLALIIAELAAVNQDSRAGMSDWIGTGLNKKWAFIGSWSYFIANIFYIPMLASRVPIMLSWVFTAKIDSLDQVVQTSGQIPGVINATSNQGIFLLIALVSVIIISILATLFDSIFEKIGKVIGWLSLGITFLFIILALLAGITSTNGLANPITIENALPVFNGSSLSTFAWILFAITGIETIGNYVGVTENAEKKVPQGIIIAAVLIIGAYIVGFISMATILTPEQVPVSHMENMTQIMYAQVYSVWGFGPLMLRITMLIYALITITAAVLWLTSTVSVAFTNFPRGIISKELEEKKINNVSMFGLGFTTIMIILFLIISNSANAGNIYTVLYDMSTTVVIVPYVLIALSYIVYKAKANVSSPYQMTKNKTLGIVISIFVLLITLVAIIFSCYDLSITDKQEQLAWFITSAGGIIFFLAMGVALNFYEEKPTVSYIILIVDFILAGIVFSPFFYIIALVLVALMVIKIAKSKK